MRVLLTAGPTSVFLDTVRVISNISSGEFAYYLYSELIGCFIPVDLFVSKMVSHRFSEITRQKNVWEFFTYEELRKLVENISPHRYDVVFHMAAVSDFGVRQIDRKIDSQRGITLELYPLPKLWKLFVDKIEKIVLFKLEDELETAIDSARQLLREDKNISMVVANTVTGGYRAVWVERCRMGGVVMSKREMAKELCRWIEENISPVLGG